MQGRALCHIQTLLLAVDVGYLWNDVGLTLKVAAQLNELDVFFLETPFPVEALPAYTSLSSRTSLRIAAGEHTVTRWEFLDLMERGGVSVVQRYMGYDKDSYKNGPFD